MFQRLTRLAWLAAMSCLFFKLYNNRLLFPYNIQKDLAHVEISCALISYVSKHRLSTTQIFQNFGRRGWSECFFEVTAFLWCLEIFRFNIFQSHATSCAEFPFLFRALDGNGMWWFQQRSNFLLTLLRNRAVLEIDSSQTLLWIVFEQVYDLTEKCEPEQQIFCEGNFFNVLSSY